METETVMTPEQMSDAIRTLQQSVASLEQLVNSFLRNFATNELKVTGDANITGDTNVGGDTSIAGKINVGKTTQLTSAYADATKLQVGEGFLVVDGQEDQTIEGENKHVQAYLGGDLGGGEVHLGSMNPKVNTIALWNPHTGIMNLRVGSIDAANIGGLKEAIDGLKSQINDLRTQIASLDPRITNAQASADAASAAASNAQATADNVTNSVKYLVESKDLQAFVNLARFSYLNGYEVFYFPHLLAGDLHLRGQGTSNHLFRSHASAAFPT